MKSLVLAIRAERSEDSMILQKEYIGFGLVERQQQHVQRHGGKSDIYLKDRWKDQLPKTQAGKNTGRWKKKKKRWEVQKGAARSMTHDWEHLSGELT